MTQRTRTTLYITGSTAGAVLGLFTTYLFLNDALRRDLRRARSTKHALAIVGSHLREDNDTFARNMRDFADRHHILEGWESSKEHLHAAGLTKEELLEGLRGLRARMMHRHR